MSKTKGKQNTGSSFGKTPLTYERALIYCRVSSDRQASEGHGLEAQEQRCREYAARKGYAVDAVFKDTYTGGGDFMDRPEMGNLIVFLDKHPYRNYVVIFDDLKRLAREVKSHFQLREELRARNAVPESPNYIFDDSPEGVFIETVHAAHNQLERQQNRRQVIQKMVARLELGYWPFCGKKGYDITKNPVHGKLCVPNHHGTLLKRAMEDFAHGVLVRKVDVCRLLVEKGFWKGHRPEKYIDKLGEMLRDCFYAGDIEYLPWEVERRQGKHEGIISFETHELIQKRLRKEGLGKRIRLDLSPDFPLRGLLICAHCGTGHITGAWSRGRKGRYPYYACQNRACAYYGKSIRKADIEGKFDDLLKRNALKDEVTKVLNPIFDRVWKQETDAMKKRCKAAAQEQSRLEEKAKKLTDMVIAAKSDTLRGTYERQLEATAQEIENNDGQAGMEIDLSVPYRTALDKATGLLKNPYRIWNKLELTDQHKLFYFMFEQKLPYHRENGYRTAEIACTTRLFEEFATANSPDVDPRRIELRPRPCHGSVIPFYYGPCSKSVLYIYYKTLPFSTVFAIL